MTHYERIKNMKVDELADFLCSVYDEDNGFHWGTTKVIEGYIIDDYDPDKIERWLKMEAEND